MKIGFCMFLWTTNVTSAHRPILEDLKATGYDGAEIPIFEGSPDDYYKLGEMLDRVGLGRTSVTAMGDPEMNLISSSRIDAQERHCLYALGDRLRRRAGRQQDFRSDAFYPGTILWSWSDQ